MKTIEERARDAAWQIWEDTDLSEHSVERVAEIIEEKIREQSSIDIMQARQFLEREAAYNGSMSCVDDLLIEELCKAIGEQI